MAIFHLHVKNISRGDGRSVLAAAAYRAGETLPNEAEERVSAFGGRRDVLHNEIRLPAGAPAWAGDRAKLWNAAEAAERRKDARLGKEIEIALPRELPRPAWLALARAMADIYTGQGYVADLAIHDDGTAHNPHLHLLLTTRALGADGFGGKLREADGLKFVTDARKAWAGLANAALAAAGLSGEIDARSHAAAGIRRPPGIHKGPDRQERRHRREAMDEERIRRARDELAAPTKPQAYPLLAARPDWPPLTRTVPEGMTEAERSEFTRFWDSVDRHRDVRGGIPVTQDEALPVPGPDRRPISQDEQRHAEDAMLADMEARGRRYRRQAQAPAEAATHPDEAFVPRRWREQAARPDAQDPPREPTEEQEQEPRWKR